VVAVTLVELPSSPDVQLLGGELVMLKDLAALDAYRLLSEDIAAVRRQDRVEPPARLQLTLAASKAAAKAARTADMSDIADVRDHLRHSALRKSLPDPPQRRPEEAVPVPTSIYDALSDGAETVPDAR
jgi:hypothetical protein